MIIRGGENIHPAEIEAVLESHPSVSEAVVLADEDRRLGEVPVAFVRSDDMDPDTMMRWCSDRLAGFKVPREIEVLAEFPRTGPGKVDRRKLRELWRKSP